MSSTLPTPAMSIPLTSIRTTLERHLSLTEGYLPPHLPSNIPLFDTNLSTSTDNPIRDYASHIASFGLPTSLASDIIKLITQESEQYRVFVEQIRLRQLRELSTTSISSDPSSIPALIEAACNAFHGLLIESGIEETRYLSSIQDNTGSDLDEQSNSEDGSDASSDSQEDDAREDTLDDGEEDDNTPIKPGEDIPPLDTKYLPIFEALHERGKVLTKPEKTYLVNMTGMTYRQITIWFQNRRRGELKESMNMAASYSKASSTHSDETSELSDQELEKTLGYRPPNTAFDIRSWRLQSALATKDGSIPPPSPLKYTFPTTIGTSDAQTDDTDLSDDSDDDTSIPPGLQAPSLTTSITTVNSSCASTSAIKGPILQSSAATGDTFFASKETSYPRPIRSLPSSRHGSPSASLQQAQPHPPNTQRLQHQLGQIANVSYPSPQCVSSNESGLMVNLEVTPQLQTSTLRSSPVSVPPSAHVSGPLSISPSPPISAGSQRQPSPRTSISPRPHIKPLPRRTGCAPRPRPPPRSGPSVSAPVSVSAPGSSRPSVVLPPSSNPSLGNTTLGALLRPNPPAPAIPQEIEERLTAMAGRMGVGRQSISSNPPRGGVPGSGALPNRNNLFSFGTSVSSGVQPVPDLSAQGSTSVPPSSR